MKKIYNAMFWTLALLIWSSPVVFAASVEFSPAVVYRDFKDTDAGVGAGINMDVKGLVPFAPIVFTSGLEYISTEKGDVNGDITTISAGIGYDYRVEEIQGLTLRPTASIDFGFIRADQGLDASNDVGFSVGGRAEYSLTERISVFAGLGYQWMGTTVSNSFGSRDISLDNFNLRSGVNVKF